MTSDPIIDAVRFLLAHDNLEWLRHRPEVDEFLTDVDACARVVAGIARGPAAQKYLGPCGADVGCCADPACRCEPGECACTPGTCDGDVYAREAASVGRCRVCGAEVASQDRRAWLDAQARSHAFRAVQIADAYGINVNTIRSWALRGLLIAHGHDGDERPLYNVGDVLDLAAADAARREEARAKRARQKQRSGEEAA